MFVLLLFLVQVPRVPQYDEGSNVEVMLDTGKHRAAWVTATVIKMVSSKNYVVRLKNKEGSVNIVDYCYIRPQPTFDRKKFEYELEPSAEVEVNLGGAWSLGVISDVGSCGYGVRLKGHDSSEEEDYMLVLRALLRPYCKQDDQELMPCTAKVFLQLVMLLLVIWVFSPLLSWYYQSTALFIFLL